jgi:hypothetical protein
LGEIRAVLHVSPIDHRQDMRPVSLSRFHDLDAFLDRFAAFFSFGVMVGFFFASGLFLSSLGIVGAPYS